ncbi:MAG TPA: hypothetical protein DD458_17265 [Prolixibacteraceae bacterium]|nr:hypothetical protein [Prolixibacteraceae bacterium]HCR89617.1 hypothetical protein [Prolixibacteraceae bacterium]HCU59964.1 hypothetical protein [Prolixibacteraceae bacterium]
MKNKYKSWITGIFLFVGICNGMAQNDSISDFSWSANVDLMSRYVWRGQQYGTGPSIQPALSGTWKNLTIGAWGAYELVASGTQETDFYISHSTGPFTFAIWDYWSYSETGTTDFFDYSENTTSHLLEAQVQVSGNEKLPLSLLGSYFFYGADHSKSIYLELQYAKSIQDAELLLFAGYQAKGNYYAEKAAFVNLGCTFSKPIALTERYSLPLILSLIVNPDRQRVQLVAGIRL